MDRNKPEIITFYGTDWCPDCLRARRLLDKNDVPYSYININKDKAASKFVQSVNNGNKSVPTIVFPNGTILVEPINQVLLDAIQEL